MPDISVNPISQAGQYDVDHIYYLKADGDGLELSNQVESINIFEDFYSPFISGKITFTDTLDLPQIFGRGGKDLLDLSITSKGLSSNDKSQCISGLFWIYRFGDREMTGDRKQRYTLFFSSVELLYDFQRQISRTFSGTSDQIIGNIIKTYYPDTTKKYNFDISSQQHKFISNFWTPSKCITYATNHAVSPKGDASFSFYENREGFNFRCLESLFDIPDGGQFQTFRENDFSGNIVEEGVAAGSFQRDANMDSQIVQSIRVETLYDYVDTYNAGAISTKLTSYDLLKKTISAKAVKARPDSRINDYALFPNNIVSSVDPVRVFASKHYANFSGFGNNTNSKYFQSRISDLKILNSSKIEIDVFGRTDYTVGKVVYYDSNIKTAITSQDTEQDVEDLVYNGFYLITAINHQFTREGHMCTMELSREGSYTK